MRLLLALSSFLPLGAPAQEEEAAPAEPYALICPITGMIDDGIAVVVKRAVEESKGASALIFEIDTPGGRVDSAIEITNSIMEAPCPTVAYIKGMGAISAGALISYACDTLLMAPGTNIGASTPVTMGGPEPSEAMNEKSMSFVRARYRTLGEEKGHDPLLGEAMVDPDIEVHAVKNADGKYSFFRVEDGTRVEQSVADKDNVTDTIIDSVFEDLQGDVPAPVEEVKSTLKKALEEASQQTKLAQGPEEAAEQDRTTLPDGSIIVSRAGELLTLTTREALEFGLSAGTAATREEVLAYLKQPDVQVREIVPTWSEELFRWLTSPLISSLLLMLGFGGLYIEIRTPGFGLPGILGLSCLALFFGSYLVIGLADWIDILLVVVGIVLILVEVFLLPGHGFMGVLGGLFLIAGLYLSMVRAPIPEFDWQFDRLREAGQTVTYATVLFGLTVLLTWKIFPKTPMYNWLILSEAQLPDQGYVVQTDAEELILGMAGISLSVLRPAGRGRFAGKTLDVVTRGEYIEANRPIRIIQVEGNRYVVAETPEGRT
ncbi:MAG: hypothetical protein HYS27_18990 [Deltaproteobacteria bacterium]|nr:hypothetical protein [Deltaproteobacteria bacterium]